MQKRASLVLAIVATVVAAPQRAPAQDRREFDPKIEKWAAERVSLRLGDLRGGFAADQSLDKATVHEAFGRPEGEPRLELAPLTPAPPAIRPEPARPVAPPMPRVVDAADVLPEVPPGVDPIITGANDRPTGNALRERRRAASGVPRPFDVGMLSR